MNLVRHVVAQVKERRRALVGDHGIVRPDGHSLLADVVVLGTGNPAIR